jgi:hypothetical protein
MSNLDLCELGQNVDRVVEHQQKKKKGKYTVAVGFSLLASYLQNTIQGDAYIGGMVCLSQAPQNGGESWCTMDYGKKFCELNAHVVR